MNAEHDTVRSRTDSVSAARKFLSEGFMPVPIPGKSKAPILKGWPSFMATSDSIKEFFAPQCNVGLLLGEVSGGLIDIDLDCAEAIALAPHFLPSTDWIHGRPSSPDSHWWYRCKEAPSPAKYQDIDGTCLLEIRSSGQQMLVPPSTHPSGERLEWKIHDQPQEADKLLEQDVGCLAACALIARHWPAEGSRQDFALSLAGTLLRGGIPEGRVKTFVRAAAEAAQDDESDRRASVVASSMERLADGRDVRGLPAVRCNRRGSC